MALLLSVGICCYLLELCSHKSSIIKHDLLLVFIDICWNYFFHYCYLLLYVAICCYLLKLFYYRHPNIDGQSKMNVNPIRARSLLELTILFQRPKSPKVCDFRCDVTSLNKSVLEFCIMGSRLTENSEVAQNFSFLIRYGICCYMLLFVVIIFISLIAAVIYCNLLLYVVFINSKLKFQHITTYSNRLVRSIVF